MIVYKYLPEQWARKAIETNRLKASRVLGLNDVYDCLPLFQRSESEDIRESEKYTAQIIKEVGPTVGLISYSRTARNMLLWSHYAESHRGIALGFELPEGIYPADLASSDIRKLKAIDYSSFERRKIVVPSFEELKPKQLEEKLEEGFSFKSPDWAYEKEYREFLTVHKSLPKGGLYFAKFSPKKLVRIVLGYRCTTDYEYYGDAAYHYRKFAYGGPFKILKATPNPEKMEMDLYDLVEKKPYDDTND